MLSLLSQAIPTNFKVKKWTAFFKDSLTDPVLGEKHVTEEKLKSIKNQDIKYNMKNRWRTEAQTKRSFLSKPVLNPACSRGTEP